MERILQSTADGSHTISIPALEVSYHSKYGAIQESKHVFIEAGLNPLLNNRMNQLNILEIGFGTGLNAFLTLITANNQSIRYESLEPAPLEIEIVRQLNYCNQVGRQDLTDKFIFMHESGWQEEVEIQSGFTLIKQPIKLSAYTTNEKFSLVYFDAFAPAAQPELWTEEIFSKLFSFMNAGGHLVTYCSKSVIRRAMQAAGFKVEKIPGPPGKREMVRAIKPNET